MEDITEKLNMLEYTMRYLSEKNSVTGLFRFDEEGWRFRIKDLKGSAPGIINLCSCNVGKYWDDYEKDEPWKKRDVLFEIVNGFTAVRIPGNFYGNMYATVIREEKIKNGLFPFQNLLLRFCDDEMMKYMAFNNFFEADEIDTAGKLLGSEANLEAYTQLFTYARKQRHSGRNSS